MTRLEPAVKWAVDRVVAAVALVVFSPVFLVIWAWVRRDAGKPVFLSQLRAGRDGVPFKLLKIRTMVPNAVDVGPNFRAQAEPLAEGGATISAPDQSVPRGIEPTYVVSGRSTPASR